jgi:hypothetical protein
MERVAGWTIADHGEDRISKRMIPASRSWWSVVPGDEERVLAKELPGYTECQHRVRHRLVPLVW